MKTLRFSGWIATIATTVAFSTLSLTTEARKIKTKHSISRDVDKAQTLSAKDEGVEIVTADSTGFEENVKPAIRFSGFDKTAGSSYESFFISNDLDRDVAGMEVIITYYDMKDRQLHKRTVPIDRFLEAGETMRVDIKTWDTQKSFYYHRSAKPKRQATPFTVKIELSSLTLKPQTTKTSTLSKESGIWP
ncbi:MAG: hypothetical protein K2G85_08020 [Muribaculaceae bacterium]|nr:hypothetical protein [Muribaculaceae bacterium]